jgi:hypothetical protein
MNFFYKIYFAIPNFERYGYIGKILDRIQTRILKRIFDNFTVPYFKKNCKHFKNALNEEIRTEKYVVSLTSFPERINDVWITIETLMRQSFKPDVLVLWLAESQFPERKLPIELTEMVNRGLTIKFCDDIRSYKKYFYAFSEYPSANIITVDDDGYYPFNTIESLVLLHNVFPYSICANRAHLITFINKEIAPYKKWKHNFKSAKLPTHLLMPTGFGGVLYPPGSLHPDAFNKELFQKLATHADDLWLKIAAILNGTKVATTQSFNKDFVTVNKTQIIKLVNLNVIGGENDDQLLNILNHYNINLKELEQEK